MNLEGILQRLHTVEAQVRQAEDCLRDSPKDLLHDISPSPPGEEDFVSLDEAAIHDPNSLCVPTAEDFALPPLVLETDAPVLHSAAMPADPAG